MCVCVFLVYITFLPHALFNLWRSLLLPQLDASRLLLKLWGWLRGSLGDQVREWIRWCGDDRWSLVEMPLLLSSISIIIVLGEKGRAKVKSDTTRMNGSIVGESEHKFKIQRFHQKITACDIKKSNNVGLLSSNIALLSFKHMLISCADEFNLYTQNVN